MDKTEYFALMRRIEEVARAATAEAERKKAENIAALNNVWFVANNDKPLPEMGDADRAASSVSTSSPIAMMRDVIRSMDVEFTIRDVFTGVSKKFPGAKTNHNSISGAMNKLNKRKEIIQIKHGSGKIPAVYCRAGIDPKTLRPHAEQQLLRMAQ